LGIFFVDQPVLQKPFQILLVFNVAVRKIAAKVRAAERAHLVPPKNMQIAARTW
jgi:hypothetical protein